MSGERRGNGRLAPSYSVEKTRFSGIRRAEDRDHDAVPEPFPAMSVGEMAFDLGDQRLGLTEDAVLDFGRQILVRKIDRRFEMG